MWNAGEVGLSPRRPKPPPHSPLSPGIIFRQATCTLSEGKQVQESGQKAMLGRVSAKSWRVSAKPKLLVHGG